LPGTRQQPRAGENDKSDGGGGEGSNYCDRHSTPAPAKIGWSISCWSPRVYELSSGVQFGSTLSARLQVLFDALALALGEIMIEVRSNLLGSQMLSPANVGS